MTEPLLQKDGGSRLAWRRPAGVLVLVCAFTACLTFKPSEPFLVVFMACVRGVPHSAIIDAIFPLWTYAQLALLPMLSVASELVGYRCARPEVALAGVRTAVRGSSAHMPQCGAHAPCTSAERIPLPQALAGPSRRNRAAHGLLLCPAPAWVWASEYRCGQLVVRR